MSKQKISGFEKTLETSYEWVDDMQAALDWDADREDVFHLLRAGLHFVRDRLNMDEVAHLSAQLPMLIRGVYYEGWNPSNPPLDIDSYDDLSSHLAQVVERGLPADPMLIFSALFKVLHKHITIGQLEDIQSMLPATMRAFWPNLAEQ